MKRSLFVASGLATAGLSACGGGGSSSVLSPNVTDTNSNLAGLMSKHGLVSVTESGIVYFSDGRTAVALRQNSSAAADIQAALTRNSTTSRSAQDQYHSPPLVNGGSSDPAPSTSDSGDDGGSSVGGWDSSIAAGSGGGGGGAYVFITKPIMFVNGSTSKPAAHQGFAYNALGTWTWATMYNYGAKIPGCITANLNDVVGAALGLATAVTSNKASYAAAVETAALNLLGSTTSEVAAAEFLLSLAGTLGAAQFLILLGSVGLAAWDAYQLWNCITG